MKKSNQWTQPRHRSTRASEPLSKSLNQPTSIVKRDSEATNISFRANSAASNTVVCYEDISVDYSQYYKESPITFEDLLSDESNTSNISSVSEEEGFADKPGAVHLTRSGYEDRNTLRAITYHKYKILQTCFTCWWRIIVAKHQRALQLRRCHLLRQGWKAFRWNMMLGQELAKMGTWHHQRWKHRRIFLKWKAAAMTRRHKRLEDAFYMWRHLTRLKISSCVSRLVAQRKVIQVFWTHWKVTLQLVRQERLAVQHFRFVLLRKSFTALLINTNSNKQKRLAHDLSEAFHNTVIRRAHFMHWKLSFHHVSTARKHCKHMLLLKSLRKWHKNMINSRCQHSQLEEQAENHLRIFSLNYSFTRWHSQVLERRAAKFRTGLLLSRYLHLWNARQKLKQCNRLSADNHYTEMIIKHVFSQWKVKYLKIQGARVNLELLSKRESLQHYFDRWRSSVTVSNSFRAAQQEFMKQHNRKILMLYFTCWRESIAEIQCNKAADNLFCLHLKQRIFGTWRQFIYQQTLRHASKLFRLERQRNILQKYFDQWVCETACSVGENVINDRLLSALCTHRLRKAFLIWLQATRTSLAARRTQTICLRKFFCKWKQKWKVQHSANNTLAHSAEESVVRKWFDKWSACLRLRILTKTADRHYTTVLLKKTYYFLTMEYKRHQAAKKFFHSVQQSSVVVCFVRWKAVLFTRTQLEAMKRSIKFQQHHLIRKCFNNWLTFTRARWQRLSKASCQLNTVVTNQRQLTAWRTWKRQLFCHQIMRDHLKRKKHFSMEQCFYHWRTITEQSLESLSATFIAKFHISSALSAGRNAARTESFCHEILIPHQDIPNTASQYQMSVLSLKSGVSKDGFVDLPAKQSTPKLPLYDKKITSSHSSIEICLQNENDTKRQLFNDTSEDLINTSQSFKLSPPCHCLDAEVVSQLTCLQQDLNSSINVLESSLSQDSNSLISPDMMNEVVLSHSDDVISPPMQFSEQCNISSFPASSIDTGSTHGSMESNSNTVLQCFSNNRVALDHSYSLFNKLVSIVKLMQHYPVSIAFVAWRQFVQRRKSLAILRTNIHYKTNRNLLMNSFTLWKLHMHKMLEYKQLEKSFLDNSRKRILSIALQKWIGYFHKCIKDNSTLNNLLISRNQHMVKNLFFKWKHIFEINIRIRNHMVNGLMLKCLHSWRNYCVSKSMLKDKIECVQTKLKRTALLNCFTQWLHEARQTRMLRVCLQCWSNFTQVKVQLRIASVAYEEKRHALLKQGLFLKWKSMTCAIVVVQKLHHQNLLKSAFTDWKGFTIKQREELFDQQQEEDKRMLTITLAHWRKITKETRLAKDMDSIRLLHYGWKKWRYRIKQEQTSIRIATVDNVHLMKKVFKAWRYVALTAAGDCNVLVVDEEDTSVLCLYFKQWKIKYMQRIHKMR